MRESVCVICKHSTDKIPNFQIVVKRDRWFSLPPAMVMAQLESQSQHQPSFDHVHKTKTLIKALNLVSRNLPLPPDLFDTVSSIYHNDEDGSLDAQVADGSDKNGLVRLLRMLSPCFCLLGIWGLGIWGSLWV